MRICSKCDAPMLEDEDMYIEGDRILGESIPQYLIVKDGLLSTRRVFSFAKEEKDDFSCEVHTAVCPVCGMAEQYVPEHELAQLKDYLDKKARLKKEEE